MSTYNLNKILYLLDLDERFLTNFKNSPQGAVATFDLTEPERNAFLAGDIRELYKMGVHTFLLTTMVRHGLLGMTREKYEAQIKSV